MKEPNVAKSPLSGIQDFKRTSTDWVDHINSLEDPNDLISAAAALTQGAALTQDDAVDDLSRLHLPRYMIIEHALEKHLLNGGSVVNLLTSVRDAMSKVRGNGLEEMGLIATDLILRRAKPEEVRTLNFFVNANEGFVSSYRRREIANIAREMGEIGEIRKTTRKGSDDLISGVIEMTNSVSN